MQCGEQHANGRRVVLLACPGTQILDAAGPAEVFARAGYRVELVSAGATVVSTSCGIGLTPRGSYGGVRAEVDTLLAVGGPGVATDVPDAALLRWLRRMAARVRRVGSVCTGAFLLGAAGLLDGRRMTTHWQWCEEFRLRFPAVQVEPDRIFVRDGRVYTSAGITAGMDLALAMVEEDLGAAEALRVARELVLFLRRPGGQSQFSTTLLAEAGGGAALRELQVWVVEHLGEALPVERLAERAAMSPRNFARVFLRETGLTPARFVERVRVDAARRRLEESCDGLEAVARACGFGSVDSLRRAFVRVLGARPNEYRQVFRTARFE